MSGKFAMIAGVLGVAWLVAMVVIGGASWDGYDHVAHYISELGANGAPYGWHVSWLGFLPIGVLICAFAVFAWIAAPRSILSTLGFVGIFLFSIGYVGSAFFRCDFGCRPDNPSFSQMMHEFVGLSGYLFAPLTASAWSCGLEVAGRRLAVCAEFCGCRERACWAWRLDGPRLAAGWALSARA
ncbi:MAG: DUF998 domain-containing protein [Terricaulis sp.]